jgi:hypothetical protein
MAGKVVGQGYMHAMAQYAEQLKALLKLVENAEF